MKTNPNVAIKRNDIDFYSIDYFFNRSEIDFKHNTPIKIDRMNGTITFRC